jgi:ABC-type protease/lipase transport system fused ATPase/permease subunit
LWGFFQHDFANVLMLTPTLYMQVYDRALASQSELTLHPY